MLSVVWETLTVDSPGEHSVVRVVGRQLWGVVADQRRNTPPEISQKSVNTRHSHTPRQPHGVHSDVRPALSLRPPLWPGAVSHWSADRRSHWPEASPPLRSPSPSYRKYLSHTDSHFTNILFRALPYRIELVRVWRPRSSRIRTTRLRKRLVFQLKPFLPKPWFINFN